MRRWLTELDQDLPQTDDAETLVAVVQGGLAERPALLFVRVFLAGKTRKCFAPTMALHNDDPTL
ncbi:MAG TPA: hypothetical protein VGJ87_08060 [Roseiflexaceae bacterium]